MVLATAVNSGNDILRPEDVGPLVVQPVIAESVAMQVATVAFTNSHDYRLPIVTADPAAEWVAEGAEITPSDADIAAVVATPQKVAGLQVITRELADDSSPEAADVVGRGLARDIARKVDGAFFAAYPGGGSVAPRGLPEQDDVQDVTITSYANLDPFAEAISLAETVGATVSSFVTNPTVALTLAQLKEATGSNKPLLAADPTRPGARTVLGVPLLVSPSVAANTVWALPKDRVYVVIRNDTRVEVDRSVFITSDQVAVRATMRVAFAFPHEAAVVRIAPAA